MDKLKRFCDIVEKACFAVIISALIGMIVLISVQVFSRYVLNHPLSWTEELSRHLMIWAAFLGAAVAYRREAHLGIDLVITRLPSRVRQVVLILINLGVAAFMVVVITVGFDAARINMRQLSSALRIPMGYIYAAIPVGSIFFLLFVAEKLINLTVKKEVEN